MRTVQHTERANWPIQQHWNRLITFAAAWSGANPETPANWTKSDQLWAAISKGLDYWFDNDYTPSDCMGNGGQAYVSDIYALRTALDVAGWR